MRVCGVLSILFGVAAPRAAGAYYVGLAATLCASGLRIASVAECQAAAEQLGLLDAAQPTLTQVETSGRAQGCLVEVATGQVQFNYYGGGSSNAAYRPVCHTPDSPPLTPPPAVPRAPPPPPSPPPAPSVPPGAPRAWRASMGVRVSQRPRGAPFFAMTDARVDALRVLVDDGASAAAREPRPPPGRRRVPTARAPPRR
jgi:hypothetical protein